MHVRPKWLRDILSMLFSGYYLFFAHEADEKVRLISIMTLGQKTPHLNILNSVPFCNLFCCSYANTEQSVQWNSYVRPGRRRTTHSFG